MAVGASTVALEKTEFLFGQQEIRSSGDGGPKECYTLESVLFLLKNAKLPHTEYARQAKERNIPVIEDAIRIDLLDYLNGNRESSKNVFLAPNCKDPASKKEEERCNRVKQGFDAELLLPDDMPHFGETLVNDVKEENYQGNQFGSFGETKVHDVKEDFFQLHYGETIVNDCKEEVSSLRLSANKRRLQTCRNVKEESDVTTRVPEKRSRLGGTLLCDFKHEKNDVV